MKNIRILFAILAIGCTGLAYGQKQNDVNTDEYPKVSFVWNDNNPIEKQRQDFVLTENGNPIDFTVNTVNVEKASKNKSVLFLWEDMDETLNKGRRGELEFTRNLLFNFLKDGVNQNIIKGHDRFNVAFFRQVGELGHAIYATPTCGFSEPSVLAPQINEYLPRETKAKAYRNPYANIYAAIDEGLDMLANESPDNDKVLVVITYGTTDNNSALAKAALKESLDKALRLNIPITMVEYNPTIPRRFDEPIVEKTFGIRISTTNASTATAELLQYYASLDKRFNGQSYQFSFTSSQPSDGKIHSIEMQVGVDTYHIDYVAPSWFETHLTLIIIIAAIIVIAIAVIVIVISSNNRKQKKLLAQQNYLHNQQIDAIKSQNQQNIDANNARIDNILKNQRNSEAIRRQNIKEQEQQQREVQLLNIMRTKNICPRLQCQEPGNTFTYSIQRPTIHIGRDTNNEVVFKSRSVSRKHASISFNGSSFEITDSGSSNHVFVNGMQVSHAALKNADKIVLGDATITFIQ